MSSTNTKSKIDYPRLRHCTFVLTENSEDIKMIVGKERFSVNNILGSRNKFLEVKRYFDGRHSIEDISNITNVDANNIQEIVALFNSLNLMRREVPKKLIEKEDFLTKIQDSCLMWSRQIGYHKLFFLLEKGEVRKEVFIGLLLETYHYVKAASQHISVALSHCEIPEWKKLLSDYFVDEYTHHELILNALFNIGISKEQVVKSHPIIGTISLVNMLCDIARKSTLSYLTCTSLFEAREENFDKTKSAFLKIASTYNFREKDLYPIIEHLEGDVLTGHNGLLQEALIGIEHITDTEAHYAINNLHDLKHSFDQYHDQILQYYSDISNYIPRLKVDYFSL